MEVLEQGQAQRQMNLSQTSTIRAYSIPNLPAFQEADTVFIEQESAPRPISRSQTPILRPRSFSNISVRGSDGTEDTPPLPRIPSGGFTINVKPGPSGTSISFSNRAQNGQLYEYTQRATEHDEFVGSPILKSNSRLQSVSSVIGDGFHPDMRNLRSPEYSVDKAVLPRQSQTELKAPITTAEEFESDFVSRNRIHRQISGKGPMRPQPSGTGAVLTSVYHTFPNIKNLSDRSILTIGTGGLDGDGRGNGEGYRIRTPDLESKENRHEYILKLARAIIWFGAPPHRLEEYLVEASLALGIRGQFLYIPGCMVCSFDEIYDLYGIHQHTEAGAEVKMVRQGEAVDMDRLDDLRHVFKAVKARQISCIEGTEKINALLMRKPQNNFIVMIIGYGFASACVGTFAFESRPIDLPMQFIFGLITGTLHVIVSQYVPFSILFEVLCPMITSFLARAVGSISNGNTFCFSALAQTAIVLILPGYVIMMAMLELQGKKVVSGAIRIVQAFLYTIFLALGIAIGTALYGILDRNATSATRCQGASLLPVYYRFVGATCFSLALAVTMQIKWKQCPLAVLISLMGFTVNFLGSLAFPRTPQVFNVIASFAIGVCGNLYARFGNGLTVGIVMPALTIQVPSAFAASAALLSGLNAAEIIHNSTDFDRNGVPINNGTSQVDPVYHASIDRVIYTVGLSMIELGVAITIGLFLSSMLVYPSGNKKRSGLFGH